MLLLWLVEQPIEFGLRGECGSCLAQQVTLTRFQAGPSRDQRAHRAARPIWMPSIC